MPKQTRFRRLGMAAQNALEIMRFGRLGRESYSAPYDVVHGDEHYQLRRYRGLSGERASGIPLLLVPPLMVAAEVYDMAADVSAISALIGQNIDVWLVDFGAPEHQSGGMERTLDDHVRAIDGAIDRVRDTCGRDVHLGGYSQGGMFAYQVAAYRQSRGLLSLVTFGSPVDIYRSLPNVDDAITDRLIAGLRAAIAFPLARIDGLPGAVTSTGFKLLSVRKEIQQVADFVRKLHDRQALIKRESRRLFLGGAGFVAWPGPAFRKFVDDIIVHNRMLSGGIVLDGKTVSLADIRVPILYFVGTRDEIARPAAVRAIERAAPYAACHEVAIKGGHFGIVVGRSALALTWPTVAQWLKWHEGVGPRPGSLGPDNAEVDEDDHEHIGDLQLDIELFYDVLVDTGRTMWNRLGDAINDLSGTVHDVRVQYPYLNRLRAITSDTPISASHMLAEQAASIPDQTFFLWRGRAFSYRDANRRIDHVVAGLIACGIQPGQRVGVLMHSRPSYLTIIGALNRLGAVATLISPQVTQSTLTRAAANVGVIALVTDPDNALHGRDAFTGPILVLGGGQRARRELTERLAAQNAGDMQRIVDMEAMDPDTLELPVWYQPNPGRARDLGLIIFGGSHSGELRPSFISNWRWAFSAFGAAAACTLSSRDTVYCSLPLHHAAGSMVAVGSALVGGSRLALATPSTGDEFWDQVRRYGATVVFYAGEMCRALVDAPDSTADRNHPVRLFAGSGMRADVWRRLRERFGGVGVLEFYASTEGNAVLANAGNDKVGAIGQPIPASAELAVVRYDFAARDFARDIQDRVMRCADDEPGILLARLEMASAGGHLMDDGRARHRVLRDVMRSGDAWYRTGAVVRRDRDGDYWFLDRLSDLVLVGDQPVFTRSVEDALQTLDSVALAVAYKVTLTAERPPVLMAAIVTRAQSPLDLAGLAKVIAATLADHMRPVLLRQVTDIAMTDGYRPLKSTLQEQGLGGERVWYWDRATHGYQSLGERDRERFLSTLTES